MLCYIKVVTEVAVNKIGDVVILMPKENKWSGFLKSMAVERNRIAISLFLSPITILDFDGQAAEAYGKIKTELEKKGTPIGPMDTLIAGHAKSRGLILVTNNTREFNRVAGLTVEDWTQE